MSATTPFQPTGPTVRITAAVSGSLPSPIQATNSNNQSNEQYVITNTGTNPVWLAYAQSATQAAANCVIPVAGAPSGPAVVYPVLNGSQITLTLGPGAWFCAITATSTSTVDITPGYGQ